MRPEARSPGSLQTRISSAHVSPLTTIALIAAAGLAPPTGAAPAPARPEGPAAPPTDRAASDRAPSAPAGQAPTPGQTGGQTPGAAQKTEFSEREPPPFPTQTLSLSEVLRLAVRTNMDLRGAVVDVDISESSILSAVGAYDVFITAGVNASASQTPQRGSQFALSRGSRNLSGNVGVRRAFETGGSFDLTLTISRGTTDQPLNIFDPSSPAFELETLTIAPRLNLSHPLLKGAGIRVNRADINRAKIARSQSEARRLQTAQNSVKDVIGAYWDVLFAVQDLDNKRKSLELAGEQLDRTQAQVSAGRLAPVDLTAVQQSLASRESDVIIAENNLLNAGLTLRVLMGQDVARTDVLGVVPTTDPVVVPREVDYTAQLERALESNPQIREFELALASKRIDELVAANSRLPQLDLTFNFAPQGRSVDQLPDPSSGAAGSDASWGEAFRNMFSDDIQRDGLLADWSVSGGLSLTWDVQNRGPRGSHERAQAEITRAKINLEQLRQTVSSNVIRATNSLRTAAKRISVTELSVELAEENLRAEQARFDVGRSTNFDVLKRLEELDLARANALSAQIEYLKATVELQALNGEILPAYGLDAS